MVLALHVLALLAYVAAAAIFLFSFIGRRAAAPRAAMWLIPTGAALHLAALVLYVLQFDEPPLVGLGASLSTLSWIIAASLTLVIARRDARSVAVVLAPLVAVLLGAALARGIGPEGTPSSFRGVWLAVHVGTALVGYASLTIAFAAALLYLLQFRELKGRRFGRVFDFFPPLETLDRLGRMALAIGFPALTLALLLGWAWTIRFQQSFEPNNPQVIWGVVTWLVFGAATLARRGVGERERRSAVVTVFGFVVVVVVYLALRFGVGSVQGFL
jgi:HemX protein